MILDIRRAEIVMGDFDYKISEKSKRNLKSRRSIYVSKKMKKGQIISKNDIQIVRPGYGLHPKYFNKIVGKRILRDTDFGERLKKNMVKSFHAK
jgi:sialic acid synthase SpsE